MLKVVCNTTPIISLIKIQHLQLLEQLYGRIIIPEAVWAEVEAGKGGQFYEDLTSHSWLAINKISNRQSLDYLTDLDKGEAEVLILAREIEANLVIIDETLGRQYAKHFGLTLTGTFGVLLRAKNENLIPAVKPLLEKLIQNGVWLSDTVFHEVLELAGE
jgi:predicted nucleic acid-binding protein